MRMKTADRRHQKDQLFEQFARIGRAVSSPRRLELLDLLSQGPRTVEVLATEAGMSVANTSQHLQALRSARLVEAQRDGVFISYRLADEKVAAFYLSLRGLARARLLELEVVARDLLQQPDGLEPMDRDRLAERVRRGEVTVLDVRPPEEYRAGHIPGALSVPLGDLAKRMKEIPRHREVVAYCRGPYCVMAGDAVALLRRRGYRATPMEDGVLEWKARGHEVVEEPVS